MQRLQYVTILAPIAVILSAINFFLIHPQKSPIVKQAQTLTTAAVH
jgi:hypothetical protein